MKRTYIAPNYAMVAFCAQDVITISNVENVDVNDIVPKIDAGDFFITINPLQS